MVDYDVIVAILASSNVNKTVEAISENLVTAFQNYTDCDGNCTGDNCE